MCDSMGTPACSDGGAGYSQEGWRGNIDRGCGDEATATPDIGPSGGGKKQISGCRKMDLGAIEKKQNIYKKKVK